MAVAGALWALWLLQVPWGGYCGCCRCPRQGTVAAAGNLPKGSPKNNKKLKWNPIWFELGRQDLAKQAHVLDRM